MASEQQVGAPRQRSGRYGFDGFTAVIQHADFGACGDEQSRLDGAPIAQRNTEAGIGADQAFFAHRDHDIAAAREGPHGGAAAP